MTYDTIPRDRVMLVRDGGVKAPHPPHPVTTSRAAEKILRAYPADSDREQGVVMMVETPRRMIGLTTVSMGSLTASPIKPVEPERDH